MNPYSIIMFCFAAALLLYAADLAITKNYNLVARNWAAKPKDEKAYTVHFAKIIALVALAPAVSGLIALLSEKGWVTALAVVVLIGGVTGAIVYAAKSSKDLL